MAWYEALTAWLADSRVDDAVGFLASVLSIIGVPGAVWQAWRARSAADAARLAALKTRARIGLLDAVHKLAATVAKLDELEERLAAGDWSVLGKSVRTARRDVIGVLSQRSRLTLNQQRSLQAMVVTLRELEAMIVDHSFEDDANRTAVRQHLLERIDDVCIVLRELQEEAVGEP